MKNRNYILGFLLVFMATLFLFVGCGKKEPMPSPENSSITLAANESTEYVIVRGNNASNSVISAASDLWKTFREKTGAQSLDLCDEYRYEEKGKPAAIVIGVINDDVSTRLKAELLNSDYIIHVENGNLYIVGGSDSATVNAVNWFVENYLKDPVTSLVLEGNFEKRYQENYSVQKLTVTGNDISDYQIVYDADLYYSKACAEELRDLIVENCGIVIKVVPDTESATANEILVGETNREESRAVVATFDRPNYYYAVKVSGSKVVVANQGARSGDAALAAIKTWFGKISGTCDVNATSLDLSGNVLSVEKNAKIVVPRSNGTDIRTIHSNVLGALSEGNNNGYSDQQRAELLADTYLVYLPDVLTLNEMSPNGNMTPILKRLLSPYYTIIDSDYIGIFEDVSGQNALVTQRKYSFPIAYRKDAGLTVIDSGFSYFSERRYFHGCSWAVFETTNGNRFLAASVHLPENTDSNGNQIVKWSDETMQIVNYARNLYGDLPMMLNGDWFFQKGRPAYEYLTSLGLEDVSETAVEKLSVGIGTFHTIGVGSQDRIEEDIIFSSTEWFKALKHRNLVDFYTINSSDHYPVLADLQFTKPATTSDIPAFDLRDEYLEVQRESAGGNDTWENGTLYNGTLPESSENPVINQNLGELLLEVTDLSKSTENTQTGATYQQAFGDAALYAYDEGENLMTSLTQGGAAKTIAYGGTTNLVLDGTSKYTVSYMATLSKVTGGAGLRISYAEDSNSIGFYVHSVGTMACLAWGGNTAPGYSGYKNFTKEMQVNGSVFGNDGYAKFDLEINGYIVSGYVNDELLFREDIRNPSNASANANITKDWMSGTVCLVWHEYTAKDQTAGNVSTKIKNLKIYSGLLHQEAYDASLPEMQVGDASDGKRNIRFAVSGVDDSRGAIGMEIYATAGRDTRMFSYETNQVCEKLTAAEASIEELTAADGAFLMGYTITDIPDDLSVSFIIRPYVVSNGKKVYGFAKTEKFFSETGVGEAIIIDFSEFGFN